MASRIPDGASAIQAVALVRSGHVALVALATARPFVSESVLITGAASGVGHLAVQLAKLQGIERVVAAVSSHTKAEFLRGLGADEIVTYDSKHWGAPVEVVLDGVGGDLLPRAVSALAPGGGDSSSSTRSTRAAVPFPPSTSWQDRKPSPGSPWRGLPTLSVSSMTSMARNCGS